MQFKSLVSAFRLLGASRDMVLDWSPEALKALRDLMYAAILALVGLVVVTIFGSWLLSGVLGLKTASIYLVLFSGYVFIAVNAYLLSMKRALHAAGLTIGVDLIANLSTLFRVGRIRYDEKEAKVKIHYRMRGKNQEDWMLHFATFQFFARILWVIVNCGINVVWFLLLVPMWAFPLWYVMMGLFAGIHWVISHRKLDFDWFTWFGTFNGVAGFLGFVAYAVFSEHLHHPHPEYALFAAVVIGFVWATEETKKYMVKTVAASALVLFVTYFWAALPSVGSPSMPDLSDETAIFRIAVLMVMLIIVIAVGMTMLHVAVSKPTPPSHHSTH